MSKASEASKASSAKLANEWAAQANDQTEEQMTRYATCQFHSFSTHCAKCLFHVSTAYRFVAASLLFTSRISPFDQLLRGKKRHTPLRDPLFCKSIFPTIFWCCPVPFWFNNDVELKYCPKFASSQGNCKNTECQTLGCIHMQKYYLALLKAIVKISAAFLIVFENWKYESLCWIYT